MIWADKLALCYIYGGMDKHNTTTEDVFVREMILHGKPLQAIQAAYPLMLEEYMPDAVTYMLDDPAVQHRINAGILSYYREYVNGLIVPEVKPVTIDERRNLLYKIITGKRKQPAYIRTNDGLRMIMSPAEPAAICDAITMYEALETMDALQQRYLPID